MGVQISISDHNFIYLIPCVCSPRASSARKTRLLTNTFCPFAVLWKCLFPCKSWCVEKIYFYRAAFFFDGLNWMPLSICLSFFLMLVVSYSALFQSLILYLLTKYITHGKYCYRREIFKEVYVLSTKNTFGVL